MFTRFKIPLVSKNKSGFRLSLIDLAMISLTILVTYLYPKNWLYPETINTFFHLFIPYLVFNFFLFCNIFRVRTKYELCWVFSATINMIASICYYNNILMFFSIQSLFTIIAIIFEIKSPTYHGIFYKQKVQ